MDRLQQPLTIPPPPLIRPLGYLYCLFCRFQRIGHNLIRSPNASFHHLSCDERNRYQQKPVPTALDLNPEFVAGTPTTRVTWNMDVHAWIKYDIEFC
jgi:hypothetical protein